MDFEEKIKLARNLKSIFFNDKTIFDYHGKIALNRFGIMPTNGSRWLTPAEIARQMIIELGYASPYEVPDEFKHI
jgi:hypothetical protein